MWKEVERDDELQKIIENLKNNPEEKSKYQWENGRLLYKGRVVLSKTSTLIPNLLHTFHNSILGDIPDFSELTKEWEESWIGKEWKQILKEYVEQCETYQGNKYEATKPVGVLQPIPIPDRILEYWSMDFI